MNTIDAAYHTVHDYPGGSESLGPRIGMSAAVLRNKVNPHNSTHHLTYAEAQRIVAFTNDVRMLQAWAHAQGYLLTKAPEGTECDMAVLEQVVNLGVANGAYMRTIHDALMDARIDQKELAAIMRAKHDLQTVAETVALKMKGMADV